MLAVQSLRRPNRVSNEVEEEGKRVSDDGEEKKKQEVRERKTCGGKHQGDFLAPQNRMLCLSQRGTHCS